ncbi:hypothetical protein Tco_0368582 [Tanacetum coccineum]
MSSPQDKVSIGHFARECNVKTVDDKARYSAFKVTEVKTNEPKALVSVDSMVNTSTEDAAAHIYMLTEIQYPLPSRVCQAMLEKKLIGDRKDECFGIWIGEMKLRIITLGGGVNTPGSDVNRLKLYDLISELFKDNAQNILRKLIMNDTQRKLEVHMFTIVSTGSYLRDGSVYVQDSYLRILWKGHAV